MSKVIPGVPMRFQVVISGEAAGIPEAQLAHMLVASISWNAWLSQYLLPMRVEINPVPPPPEGLKLVDPGR